MVRVALKNAAKQTGNVLKEVAINEGQAWTKGQDTMYDKYNKYEGLKRQATPVMDENLINRNTYNTNSKTKPVYDFDL